MGMVSLDACIYTIIAILSVAYPILLQVISRLDDKYSSARAVGLFEEEPVRKWFERLLIGSVAAVVIWFLCHLVPASLVQALGCWRAIVVGIAYSLVCLTTGGLLVCFFLLTRKTLTYFNAQKLSGYLQAGYLRDRAAHGYFEVLSDMFVAAVATRNSSLAPDIAHFFSEQFAEVRGREEKEAAKSSREKQEITYPAAYYELTYRSTEEAALLGTRKPVWLTHLTAGGGWLLGGHHHLISERTYAALWHNLRTTLDYNQLDMVYEYWRTAHQYVEYELQRIRPDYEREDFSFRVTNEPAIRRREQERARYQEFHDVLGALLLYTGRGELLRRLFDHTTSQPPRYPLLPAYMTEIFAQFVDYYRADHFPPLDTRYSFPNEAGLAAESLITKWVFTYLAVLFLRQYTLVEYLIGDAPLAHPMLPEGQPAKKIWLNALTLIRRYVTQVLQDEELLRSLRLEFITEVWCRQRGVEYPLDMLTAVEQELQTAYRQGADTVELSPEKVAEFYADSGRILDKAAVVLQTVAAPDGARTFAEARYLQGAHRLVDKDEFADNPEIAHLNFSSALASGIAHALGNNVARLFARNQSVKYHVAQSEVFAALDNLELGQDDVILNLGLNLSYLAEEANLVNWQPDSYRGSEVLDFRVGGMSDSLLVMRRDELPAIRFLRPDPAEVEKYGLVKISQQVELYASVLDANNLTKEVEAEVRNGDFGDFADEQLKTQALEILWLSLEFKWQQQARLVWLQAPYHQPGKASDLAAITTFGQAGSDSEAELGIS